jgi:hypothetical protein
MHRIVLNVVAPRRSGPGGQASAAPADACHPAGTPAPPTKAPPTGPGRESPSLEPGDYTVRLSVDGQTLTQHVKILPDPRALPRGAEVSPEEDDDQ